MSNRILRVTLASGKASKVTVPANLSQEEALKQIKASIPAGDSIVGISQVSVEEPTKSEQVAKLRQEAEDIASKVATPQASEAYGRSVDARDAELAAAKKRMDDMVAAQHSDLFSLETLKQAGRGFPKLVTSSASAIANPEKYPNAQGQLETDRWQTFADRFQLPYQSDLAQETLGDPTLLPSMLIPGVGEAKMAILGGKLIPKVEMALKAIYGAKEVSKGAGLGAKTVNALQTTAPKLIDNAVQSGASMLAPGEQDFTGNLLAGTAVGEIARGAGSLAKAGGSRLIQSVIKPGAGVDKKKLVTNLMDAKLPDSEKKVIGPFTTTEKAITDVEDAIQAYGEKETGGISRVETDQERGWNAATISSHLNDVEAEIYQRKLSRDISPEEADRMYGILASERVRLTGKKPSVFSEVPISTENPEGINVVDGARVLPDPTLLDLHRAKQDYGTKSRFDQKNTSTADPTVRNTYQLLYDAARGGIVEEEGARIAADLKARRPEHALNRADVINEKVIKNSQKLTQLVMDNLRTIEEQLSKSRPDLHPEHRTKAALDILTSTPEGAQLYEAWGKAAETANTVRSAIETYSNNLSPYNYYSREMAPLMAVREPLGKAYDRNANTYPLSLQVLLAAATGAGASQSPWGLLAGVAPAAIQSMPSGTAMYRLGEALPGAAAKINPLLMRAMPDVPQEDEPESMVNLSTLSNIKKP